ncbi:MAG: hypothetical protein ACO3JG_15600, partial [Luteolibacter sp.]
NKLKASAYNLMPFSRRHALQAFGLAAGAAATSTSIGKALSKEAQLLRQELQQELNAALEAVDEVPAHYLDRETARDLFRALAADGDDDWARAELLLELEPSPGSGVHFDRLMDHINKLGWAYWRLHRAERRAYGKEGA